MLTLKCNQPTYFDVDDTLVKWNMGRAGDPGVIAITCPASRTKRTYDEIGAAEGASELVETECSVGEWTEYLVPHKKHIDQLKMHKARGHTIIVWSAGGWEWADAVVKALGLTQYVDLCIEKPMWAYDDLQPNEFIKTSYYKDYDEITKE
jgi:phosphoserine phosphatase